MTEADTTASFYAIVLRPAVQVEADTTASDSCRYYNGAQLLTGRLEEALLSQRLAPVRSGNSARHAYTYGRYTFYAQRPAVQVEADTSTAFSEERKHLSGPGLYTSLG